MGLARARRPQEHHVGGLAQEVELGQRWAICWRFTERWKADREARRRHALWFIRHLPTSEVAGTPYVELDPFLDPAAYDEARTAWVLHLEEHAGDPPLLWNAASFFTHGDPALAGRLLRKGRALQPDEPRWTSELAHQYLLRAARRDGGYEKRLARRAIRLYVRDRAL